MKALSFRQPRAEQIVRGEKTVDVRTWQASYRGPLLVHASATRRDGRCRLLGFDPAALDYGALIGTVELVDVEPLDEERFGALREAHCIDGPFPGAPCFGWRLADPRRLAEPVSYRGRVRLFDVDWGPGGAPATQSPRRSRQVDYRTTPPPQPDPERPFVLYTIPEAGEGYRVALYQWLRKNGDAVKHAPGAMWGIELGGDPLRAVADHLIVALRANGYRATELARAAGSEKPFYLNEPTGVRLALILLAVKPLGRHDRIEAIGQGIHAMGDEEAYYWFSKCSAGPDATRAQKALRVLLAQE